MSETLVNPRLQELKRLVEALQLEDKLFYTKQNKSSCTRARNHCMDIVKFLKDYRATILTKCKELPTKHKTVPVAPPVVVAAGPVVVVKKRSVKAKKN
jgi:hypothetical protein